MTVSERLKAFARSQGLSTAAFERACGLSNGYVGKAKGNFETDTLDSILRAYPTLNKDWLLTGEGDMVTSSQITQSVNGHNNTAVAGNQNSVHSSAALEIALQSLAKSQEQIDRLISLIEKMQENGRQ